MKTDEINRENTHTKEKTNKENIEKQKTMQKALKLAFADL